MRLSISPLLPWLIRLLVWVAEEFRYCRCYCCCCSCHYCHFCREYYYTLNMLMWWPNWLRRLACVPTIEGSSLTQGAFFVTFMIFSETLSVYISFQRSLAIYRVWTVLTHCPKGPQKPSEPTRSCKFSLKMTSMNHVFTMLKWLPEG